MLVWTIGLFFNVLLWLVYLLVEVDSLKKVAPQLLLLLLLLFPYSSINGGRFANLLRQIVDSNPNLITFKPETITFRSSIGYDSIVKKESEVYNESLIFLGS